MTRDGGPNRTRLKNPSLFDFFFLCFLLDFCPDFGGGGAADFSEAAAADLGAADTTAELGAVMSTSAESRGGEEGPFPH